jgi:preprotein translocase SecE subunit
MGGSQTGNGDPAGPEAGSAVVEAGAGTGVKQRPAKRKAGARDMERQAGGDDKPTRAGARGQKAFFDVYKGGQGAYTRKGTALGAAILTLAGANFLYEQLSVFRDDRAWTLWLQTGIPLLMVVLLGLITFWVVGVNRKACDFMIATEGEMKKVHWSSRREIVGSTKVVILFTILLAIILFIVDLIFMSFFSWIGVLRQAPSILKLLLGGGP